MPETFQAVAVAALALLPGALYVWSYERQTGLWGINLPDRILRFLGVSALFHVLAAPFTYWLWFSWVHDDEWKSGGHLPWGLYAGLLAYVALPIAAGSFLGRSDLWLARVVRGGQTPPRAWDFFFSQRPDGWIRAKLRNGPWVGGAYAEGSYASGYPEPHDIYIADAADVDPTTGEFIRGDDGRVILRQSALLVASEAIEYLEFNDA
jgi:uncharacterized protein DUF6338